MKILIADSFCLVQFERIIRECLLADIDLEEAIVNVSTVKMVTLGVVCIQLVSRELPTANRMLTDFSHDHARSRAYRWGEDGIAGVCDTHGQLNIAFSFWNEKELVLTNLEQGRHTDRF